MVLMITWEMFHGRISLDVVFPNFVGGPVWNWYNAKLFKQGPSKHKKHPENLCHITFCNKVFEFMNMLSIFNNDQKNKKVILKKFLF